MIGKMRIILARMTTKILVEYSLIAAALIVAITNVLLVLLSHRL
jgi:hypothetical protein